MGSYSGPLDATLISWWSLDPATHSGTVIFEPLASFASLSPSLHHLQPLTNPVCFSGINPPALNPHQRIDFSTDSVVRATFLFLYCRVAARPQFTLGVSRHLTLFRRLSFFRRLALPRVWSDLGRPSKAVYICLAVVSVLQAGFGAPFFFLGPN